MVGACIYGRLTAIGKVRTDIAAISNKLRALPALRRLSSGSVLRYALAGERGATLSISQNSISMRYVSDGSIRARGEALAKLMAVAAVLRDDYYTDFESVYQDVIEALLCGSGWNGRRDSMPTERLSRQLEALTISNFNLSNEIYKMERKMRSRDAELELYRKLHSRIGEYCDRTMPGSSRTERLGAIVGRELASEVCSLPAGVEVPVSKMIPWRHITH